MHDLAIITKIQEVKPIEGRDRIELVKVMNYDSIVEKGVFHKDDIVCYVTYDAILPDKPEFEFLRKRCWSEKWHGHRIRPMKMGNVVSEGLVLPMSILPNKNYKEGQNVTEDLQIRHYDPEGLREMEQAEKKKKGPVLTFLFKFGWFRKVYLKFFVKKAPKKSGYPTWIIKSDEENIEKIWDEVSQHPETEYIVTEKMEGQAATFSWDGKSYKVYSHNFEVTGGNWVEVSNTYDIGNKIKAYCKKCGWSGMAIQGEVCGPGIQGNIYGFPSLKLFLYGGFYEDGTRLTFEDILDFSIFSGIPTVPVIKFDAKITDYNGLKDIIQKSDGNSVFKNKGKEVLREGLVWRTEDGRVHWKNKSRLYKVKVSEKINESEEAN